MAAFHGAARARAIALWTAWSSVAIVVGPVVGGVAADSVGWRAVFAVLAVPVVIIVALLPRLPASRPLGSKPTDVVGAGLTVVAIGGVVVALVESSYVGWASPIVILCAVSGLVALIALVFWERRVPAPIIPGSLFRVAAFTIGNAVTAAAYAGLALASFAVALFLQEVWGFTATLAGLATLPPTLVLLSFSTLVGRWSARIGNRWLMVGGCALSGVGMFLVTTVGESPSYWSTVLPALVFQGVGLTLLVSPLTSSVLNDVPDLLSGTASAINNAVARIAGLIVVALAGVIFTGGGVTGFRRAAIIAGILFLIGAATATLRWGPGRRPLRST